MKSYHFTLPLKNSFFSLKEREIEIWTDENHQTLVEYAPFPGLHFSTSDSSQNDFKRYQEYLLSEFNYFKRKDWVKEVRDISFNGFVTYHDSVSRKKDIDFKFLEKFSVIKVKCARNTIEEDIDFFNFLCNVFPKAKFRLDANQLWGSRELKKFSKSIDLNCVDYFEEPTVDSSQLCGDYPIALDETVLTEWTRNKDSLKGACALIVKPHLYGHIDEVLSLISWGNERQIPVILSSLFNSSVGTQNLLRLACLCSGSGPHGLGPFFHLEQDSVDRPLCAHGDSFSQEEICRPLEIRR